MKRTAPFLLALVLSGCVHSHPAIGAMFDRDLCPPAALTCRDGRPVRVVVGEACPDGVCGWTCAPDRWRGTDPLTAAFRVVQ